MTATVEKDTIRSEAKPRSVRKYSADISAMGEPFLWGLGGALAFGIILIVGFLALIFWNGFTTFWPKPIEVVTITDGTRVAGEPFRSEQYRPGPEILSGLTDDQRAEIVADEGFVGRTLYRTGNYDVTGEDFRWVSNFQVTDRAYPKDFFFFERQEWGAFVGTIASIDLNGRKLSLEELTLPGLEAEQEAARDRFDEVHHIERTDIGNVNHEINELRLDLRRAALRHGEGSPEYQELQQSNEARIAELQKDYLALANQARAIKEEDRKYRITLQTVNGEEKEIAISQIVRFYAANDLSFFEKVGVYLSRWGEFVSEEPREANTEGGILPAIFGTVVMTMLMVIIVAPFGVITALYLREYAKQGRLVTIVRISVNNLAGVPSIVYGVFGVGFFAYMLGGSIDALFYPERLPSPTFGTGGILWSALTLALLTVPVVIVATEEALSAVPRSMREGSLACGASKWQTIKWIVLPRAMPGVMTGLILAMARGAGEVAPLMLIGVVKLAPELPIDGFFPYVHLERSFMHLGFHIFDVGFQSRNSEAGKPMVFVTTLLLIGLIVLMNSSAIYVRNRLKKKFAGSQF
ncbi:MAG: phosphate ABC transporter permease PstA [Alphaproteobacteria bacterium]|nr:phosphate ABC transporter permease PstA [Alphaproteobacteria bacterium]MBU0798505.1 phosphate ABC transporter permease PstA [Alphaproteobacteria bacterium]MBU0886215.1 phosphate ABC transporter permease PstA [Alphaproteobacteria bacterium]MBU1812855.1 phosphate ABC transporter permease PstA [Alphaproteobacteria bacterium]